MTRRFLAKFEFTNFLRLEIFSNSTFAPNSSCLTLKTINELIFFALVFKNRSANIFFRFYLERFARTRKPLLVAVLVVIAAVTAAAVVVVVVDTFEGVLRTPVLTILPSNLQSSRDGLERLQSPSHL